MNIERGGVYLAALDPTIGHEIAKTRPVLVVSNHVNNAHAGTVTVLPITSKKTDRTYPFEVYLPLGTGNLPKNSKAKADQIRTLDRSRIIKRIGRLEKKIMTQVDVAMRLHLQIK